MVQPVSTNVSEIGVVARDLDSTGRMVDGNSTGGQRMGRYGENYVLNVMPDLNVLADEGCFFAANNNQTGIATAAAPTAFSATNPFLSVYNADAVNGRRLYLDTITLIATAAGTAGASVQCAITIDNGNRFTSGGTALTPSNTNMDSARRSVAIVNAGNLVAAAASASVRTPVGNRFLKGAIPVAGDEYVLKFGGVDATAYFNISTILKAGVKLPPVIIGPQQTMLLHLWLPSQSAASSYLPELNWWER